MTKIKTDVSLLCSILQNQSETMDYVAQSRFVKWIILQLSKIDPDASFEQDDYGNLYVTKGVAEFYPCVVAHLDTVHIDVDNFIITRVGDYILAIDGDTGEQTGCGADDRVGIYVAFEMFKRHKVCKLFFPMDEESGCQGTARADMEFFNDCSFLVQPDRGVYKNKLDYITFTNGVETTTKEFNKEVLPIVEEFGFKEANGSYTDIGELLIQGAGCCAFNISCYYNAHTSYEVINIPLLDKVLNVIDWCFTNLSYKRWDIEIISWKSSYDNVYDSWNDWDEVVKEDYTDAIFEDLSACVYNCEGNYVDETIDGCMYCNKCGKTLGENYLLNDITKEVF